MFFADVKSASHTIFHLPVCCNLWMDADGAVGLVRTSASCRSLFTYRVLIPVARICCRVAVTSIDVLFSDKPSPSDSFFSRAS